MKPSKISTTSSNCIFVAVWLAPQHLTFSFVNFSECFFVLFLRLWVYILLRLALLCANKMYSGHFRLSPRLEFTHQKCDSLLENISLRNAVLINCGKKKITLGWLKIATQNSASTGWALCGSQCTYVKLEERWSQQWGWKLTPGGHQRRPILQSCAGRGGSALKNDALQILEMTSK